MKKLLLSLFAIATVFVACDKEAIDSQEPTAIEISEANASLDSNLDTDLLIESLMSRYGVKGFEFTSSPSSSRTGTATVACAEDTRDGQTIDGSTDYITYELATINGSNYGIIKSEAETFTAPFTPVATLAFVNKGSGLTKIFLNGNYVNEFTSTPFEALYDNALLANAYVENLNHLFIYLNDGNLNDAGLSCVNAGQYYEVTPAPFPLNGFLARITNPSGFAGNSLNYAASTEAAVRTAIEADIADGRN